MGLADITADTYKDKLLVVVVVVVAVVVVWFHRLLLNQSLAMSIAHFIALAP